MAAQADTRNTAIAAVLPLVIFAVAFLANYEWNADAFSTLAIGLLVIGGLVALTYWFMVRAGDDIEAAGPDHHAAGAGHRRASPSSTSTRSTTSSASRSRR